MSKKMMSFVVLVIILFCALYFGKNVYIMTDEINTLGNAIVKSKEGFITITGDRLRT